MQLASLSLPNVDASVCQHVQLCSDLLVAPKLDEIEFHNDITIIIAQNHNIILVQ